MKEQAPIYLCYATHDGHTRSIVTALARHIEELGQKVFIYDLALSQPIGFEIEEAEPLVIVAPIRYGKPLPEAEFFVRQNAAWLREHPPVVISVNLTARKPEKNTPETNPYLRTWLRRHKLQPLLAFVLAGRLEYQRYSWWERQIIRFIMMLTGGPTDPYASVDYTPWEKLEGMAQQIVAFSQKDQQVA